MKEFWNILKPVRDFIANQFITAFNQVKDAIKRVWTVLEPHKEQLLMVAKIVGGILLIGFAAFTASMVVTTAIIAALIIVVARLIGWFAQFYAKLTEINVAITNWYNNLRSSILSAVANFGTLLWNAGWNLQMGLLRGIVAGWNAVWGFLASTDAKIKGAVGSLWGILWDAGWHAMNSLWQGMIYVWNSMAKWIKGLADWIKKNKGPIDKDRKMLVNEGNAIMVGLNRGLLSGYRVVQDTIASINNSISKSIQPSLVVTGNAPTGNTSVNNNIYGNITLGDQGAVDRFFDQLNRNNELARRGMTTV